MMHNNTIKDARGYSLIELILAMTIMLIVLGLAFSLFGKSLTTRQRESSRTDALTAAQAALNVISREISNSGYGLTTNGIVSGDSNDRQLHIMSNVINTNLVVTDPGEDLTYFYEPATQSILRYDANKNGPGSGETSIIINRISNVEFRYFDYVGANPVGTEVLPATGSKVNTGRLRVKITVALEPTAGQPNPSNVQLISDVTLRNSEYMMQQY
jgi:prepilin-type N-terminal cleavage/methylation domain-containing protein